MASMPLFLLRPPSLRKTTHEHPDQIRHNWSQTYCRRQEQRLSKEWVMYKSTNKIESYAIENCPNLKKAYVPNKTTVDTDVFYGVHSTFQIIRK